MSRTHLPAELLDHIVDLLYDTPDTLNSCCLVSKSWIPRTRKHLFSRITFRDAKNMQSWKNAFPDPSTSPASYAKSLSIKSLLGVTVADAEEGGWIPTFRHVVVLELGVLHPFTANSVHPLVRFHGFSPSLKSLSIMLTRLPPSHTLNLVQSFPLLEDFVAVVLNPPNNDDDLDKHATAVRPPITPAFTGRLKLSLAGGMGPLASRLLALPGGLHFEKLDLAWFHKSDVLLTARLVEMCCSTLKSLSIRSILTGEWGPGPIDLSKLKQLKRAAFSCGLHPRWVIATLETVTLNHRGLHVTFDARSILFLLNRRSADSINLRDMIGDHIYLQWLELDRLFARFSGSHLIVPKILYKVPSSMSATHAKACMESLLQESTKQRMVDLAKGGYSHRDSW